MPVRIRNRREDPRNPIPGYQDAEIEFCAVSAKKKKETHRFPLVELSAQGGSFRLPTKLDGLEPGATINDARVCLGEIRISVHLEVLHVTRGEGSSYICGIRIYPVSVEDHNELTGLVSRLEQLPE